MSKMHKHDKDYKSPTCDVCGKQIQRNADGQSVRQIVTPITLDRSKDREMCEECYHTHMAELEERQGLPVK